MAYGLSEVEQGQHFILQPWPSLLRWLSSGQHTKGSVHRPEALLAQDAVSKTLLQPSRPLLLAGLFGGRWNITLSTSIDQDLLNKIKKVTAYHLQTAPEKTPFLPLQKQQFLFQRIPSSGTIFVPSGRVAARSNNS